MVSVIETKSTIRIYRFGRRKANFASPQGNGQFENLMKDNPGHSWRMMAGNSYFKMPDYDFSASWDSKKNRPVWKNAPLGFRGFFNTPAGFHTARWLAVLGPGSAWPMKARPTSDPLGHGILFVEVAKCDIIWCEPVDSTLAEVQEALLPNSKLRFKCEPDGFCVMGSGEIRTDLAKVIEEVSSRLGIGTNKTGNK